MIFATQHILKAEAEEVFQKGARFLSVASVRCFSPTSVPFVFGCRQKTEVAWQHLSCCFGDRNGDRKKMPICHPLPAAGFERACLYSKRASSALGPLSDIRRGVF